MKILVATRNRDKFSVTERMVAAIARDVALFPLSEIGISGGIEEAGTIEERAAQKARYFLKRLEVEGKAGEFDAVLGIDDGFSIAGGSESPCSDEIADRLLRSEWKAGTSVLVIRAFALLTLCAELRTEVTRIPYTFLGNTSGVARVPGKYVLGCVLAFEGSAVPVSELSPKEQNDYNLIFSRDSLARLLA